MYTVIILTADDCSYCQRFKLTGTYDTIHSSVSKLPNIQSVLKVNLSSMSSPMPGTVPLFMNKFNRLFPSIILVNASNWILNNNTIADDTYGFNYIIRNGVVDIGGGKDGDLTASNIVRWVQEKTTKIDTNNNNNVIYHNNGSQYFCTSTDTGERCVRKKTSRRKK